MMANSKMMNASLTRGNVCDALRAITCVRTDSMRETKDESTTEDRKKLHNLH